MQLEYIITPFVPLLVPRATFVPLFGFQIFKSPPDRFHWRDCLYKVYLRSHLLAVILCSTKVVSVLDAKIAAQFNPFPPYICVSVSGLCSSSDVSQETTIADFNVSRAQNRFYITKVVFCLNMSRPCSRSPAESRRRCHYRRTKLHRDNEDKVQCLSRR